MIIDTKKLENARKIEFSGNEAWLEPIYELLPKTPGQPASTLSGWVELKPGYDEVVELAGEFKLSGYYPNGKDNEPGEVQVNEKLELWLVNTGLVEEGDLEPSANDLDSYYMKDNQIDLSEVIADKLYHALPASVIASRPSKPKMSVNELLDWAHSS